MITLEEIAGYLPYRLKIAVTTDRGVIYKEVTGLENDRYPEKCEIPFLVRTGLDVRNYVFYHKNYKPILHPLSDLTCEIDLEGERFIPTTKLCSHGFHNEFWNNPQSKYLQYQDIQKLLQWHFDIHGLIERGDAIDINTVNE
jgi:hypothetical protein